MYSGGCEFESLPDTVYLLRISRGFLTVSKLMHRPKAYFLCDTQAFNPKRHQSIVQPAFWHFFKWDIPGGFSIINQTVLLSSQILVLYFYTDIFNKKMFRNCYCIFSFLGLHIHGCVLDWYLWMCPWLVLMDVSLTGTYGCVLDWYLWMCPWLVLMDVSLIGTYGCVLDWYI